jgi:hypothetical protein
MKKGWYISTRADGERQFSDTASRLSEHDCPIGCAGFARNVIHEIEILPDLQKLSVNCLTTKALISHKVEQRNFFDASRLCTFVAKNFNQELL